MRRRTDSSTTCIAHGVYSWVPPAVRDGLFALAATRLAPSGLMFVSFNALPGCRVRQAAWDVLHRHVDHLEDPRARLAAARELAAIIGTGNRSFHEADDAVRAEFRAIAQSSDSELCHDTLAVPNDPVYFHDFTLHAARFGLRYLAEAELHSMSAVALSPEARAFVSKLDPAAREEYLDFVRLRRFRQSLLCRVDAPSDPAPLAARLDAMHVAADRPLLQAVANGKLPEMARQLDPAHGGGGPVRMLLEHIAQRAPAALPVNTLREWLTGQALPRPLEFLLTDAYVSNLVNLHLHPPAVVAAAGKLPVAGLARPLRSSHARRPDVLAAHAGASCPIPMRDGYWRSSTVRAIAQRWRRRSTAWHSATSAKQQSGSWTTRSPSSDAWGCSLPDVTEGSAVIDEGAGGASWRKAIADGGRSHHGVSASKISRSSLESP